MERDDVLQQMIRTIRNDIVRDPNFIRKIFDNYKITMDNFDPQTLQKMISMFRPSGEVRRPVSNAPKDVAKGESAVAKPIVVTTEVSQMVSDLLDGNNIYLMGKAGTGKTYLAEAIAETILGQPKFMINCSQWTSPIEIRGGQTIEGYQEGILVEAWAKGGVLILDELPKLDPNTAGLLNAALAEASKQPKYDENGKVIEKTIPTITNGRGEKIKKGQDQTDESLKYRFCVIATGNTDMMNVGNKYAGNNRQDYSLVDRFAGSYYTLEKNKEEATLVYPYVYNISDAIRDFLNSRQVIQSVSLRTMLNFNRTYEQEMLSLLESPFADEIFDNDGKKMKPKTIENSIDSFKSMLDPNTQKDLENDDTFKKAMKNKPSASQFILEFMRKYHLNPLDKRSVEFREVEVVKDGKKQVEIQVFYTDDEKRVIY